MIFRLLADGVVIFHGAFVAFVVAGGLLVLRWRKLMWAHIPAALWGALIEFGGWICPLTPLENWLRARAGQAGYAGGFVQHYVLGALYPEGLTAEIRWALGAFVVIVNGVTYAIAWRARRSTR
jgi:Protein of Unknown function (DUF2784)